MPRTVVDLMSSHRGISKLKALLLIDIIIVALAAGTYLYLTSSGMITQGPKPAEFQLADLGITPAEAAGITIQGKDKWRTLIQNAVQEKRKDSFWYL